MSRKISVFTVRVVIVNLHDITGYIRDTPKDVDMEEKAGVKALDDIISIIN